MWYHPKLSYKRSWKSFVFTGIIDGHPAKTKAGELSIVPKEIQILAPCMKILPTTGLVDQSFKYRHRHVDLMLNPQVRSIFYTRSKIVNSIRQYLNSELFLFPWAIYCHYLTSFLRAIFVDRSTLKFGQFSIPDQELSIPYLKYRRNLTIFFEPKVELRVIFVDLMLNPIPQMW